MDVWKKLSVSTEKSELEVSEASEQALLSRVAQSSTIAASLAAVDNQKPKRSRKDVMKRRAKQRKENLVNMVLYWTKLQMPSNGFQNMNAPAIANALNTRERRVDLWKGLLQNLIFLRTTMDRGGLSTAHIAVASSGGGKSRGRRR